MKFIRESEAPAVVHPAPYARTVATIAESDHLWMGICTYPAGSSGNPHFHETQEETFYCIAGKGQIKVDDTVFDLVPGDAVFVQPGEMHVCMNLHGAEEFRVVAVVTPPPTP